MRTEPYISSEDSRLLRDALKDYSGDSCLEIGAGNGGSLIELRKRFGVVVGTDILLPGMGDWRSEGVNFVLADRASCMRPSMFDLVAFNPPYLKAEVNDTAVDGGEDLQVSLGFLQEALRVVKKSGMILFLLNGEADIRAFASLCRKSGFTLERVASRRLFFEELSVYFARMA